MRQGFTSYKDGTLEDLLTEMQAELSTLPKQEAKVVQFILLNVDSLSFETGRSATSFVLLPSSMLKLFIILLSYYPLICH